MIIKVRVNKWDKYNPRSDVKSSSWYRQQNDFFNDPNFYKASPATRLVWMYILCQASKRMDGGIAKINTEMMADVMLLKRSEIEKSIKLLEEIECIEPILDNVISTRSDTVVPAPDPCSTNERTDERTNENERSQASVLEHLVKDSLIRSWLRSGDAVTQSKIFSTYQQAYLSEAILAAYAWQKENRKRKAGSYLSAWIERDKNKKVKPDQDPFYKFMIESGACFVESSI